MQGIRSSIFPDTTVKFLKCQVLHLRFRGSCFLFLLRGREKVSPRPTLSAGHIDRGSGPWLSVAMQHGRGGELIGDSCGWRVVHGDGVCRTQSSMGVPRSVNACRLDSSCVFFCSPWRSKWTRSSNFSWCAALACPCEGRGQLRSTLLAVVARGEKMMTREGETDFAQDP